jgi:hypothetical protein
MSNTVAGKLSGKVLFGVDYLNIMRFMELPDKDEKYDENMRHVVDAVARMFLLNWDFTVEEIDQANQVFWDKVNSEKLDEKVVTVVDRIVDFLKGDRKSQEKFIIEVAAVSMLDDTFIDNEGFMKDLLQTKFDLRPSEIEVLYKRGWDWQVALNFVGEKYVEAAKEKQKN